MKQRLALATLIIVALIPASTAITATVLSTDPAPAEPGEYTDVTIRLEARSGEDPLTDATLRPVRSDLIRPVDEPQTYSSIQEGDVITKTFKLFIADDAPEGDLPLFFRLTSDNQNITFERSLRVTSALDRPELRIGGTETTPREIVRDTDDNELSLTVNNLGDDAAKQVTAELVAQDGFTPSYAYSLRDTAASIPANGEHMFTYAFDLDDEEREAIQTELQLEYREDSTDGTGEIEQTTLDLTIPYANAPFLTVTDVTTADGFRPGSVGNELRVTVANNGSGDAEEVRVRLFPDISYPFLFDTTTQYVASNLEPGENATAVYEVEVENDAATRDYPVTTELESLVGSQRYEQEDTVSIPVRGEPTSTYGWLPYAAAAAVLLLAVIIGVYQKTRRHSS